MNQDFNTMNKNADGIITGQFATRLINEKFYLKPLSRGSEKAPTHEIIAKAPAGHYYSAGIAKEYNITRGDMSGRTGFNLWFNDPSFGEKGVNVDAYPNNLMGWDLRLSSFKPEQQEQQQAA